MSQVVLNPKVFAPEYTDEFNNREQAQTIFNDPKFQYDSRIMSTDDFKLTPNYTFNDTKVTRFGFENYMSAIGIPNVFAKKIPFDLLVKNQNSLKKEFEKALTVFTRKSDGAIINFANHKTKTIPTNKIFDKIEDEFLNNGQSIQNSYISTQNIKLLFEVPIGDVVEPTPGDVIKFGKVITNSEVGIGALVSSLMTYRLICSNGAIMGSEWGRIVRRHNGDLSTDEIVNNFMQSYNTLLPNADALKESFNIMKSEHVYVDEIVNVYSKIFKILRGVFALPEHSKEDIEKIDSKISEILKFEDVNFNQCLEKISERKQALKDPFKEIPERERHASLTYYDMFNKVTEIPHVIRRNVKATNEIEVIGGNIINQVLKNFNSQFVQN